MAVILPEYPAFCSGVTPVLGAGKKEEEKKQLTRYVQ
jgi:hypothetical protein